MEYFRKLQELLEMERQEDRQAYMKIIENHSVQQRREAGLSWYPVAIRGSEMSRGDYLNVELERTSHRDLSHHLRFGMPAALFSNHDPKGNRVDGIITHQHGNLVKIIFKADELPDWSHDGKLGVDLLFDENSYIEMQKALKQADKLHEQKQGRLVRILTGDESPGFLENTNYVGIDKLNKYQNNAVNNIINARDLAIVHGPPGTGKTTTIVQAAKELVKTYNQKLLVVAPSNTAVDLLTEKLHEEGLNVLRVGNPVRVSESLMSLTLDSKMNTHPQMKDIKNLRKQANEYRDMAHKYKRHFGRSEQNQRKALFHEAHKIIRDITNIEQYIMDDVIGRAQIITATLVGANHHTVENLRYDTVIIDEAGQALEPACWIPMLKAKKVVLAGDHCQLSPTVKSEQAAREGLSTTLLEKLIMTFPQAVVLLQEQYRMNVDIMNFSSREFYDGRLKANVSVAAHRIAADEQPLEYVDTAGCGYEEKLEGTSSYNPEEASFLYTHLTQLVSKLKTLYTVDDFPSIAIISPYKQQVTVLRELLAHQADVAEFKHRISVNTIDGFQGQERDVVYISLTRSNSDGTIGFLSEVRRMNVAMTRARKKLVVVGDSGTISQSRFYSDFIAYAEEIGAYKSAWDYLS